MEGCAHQSDKDGADVCHRLWVPRGHGDGRRMWGTAIPGGKRSPPGRLQCSRRRQQKGEAALKKDEDEDTAQGEAENAGRSKEGRQIAAAPRLKLGVSLAAGQVFGGGALQRSLLTHACRLLVD